MSGKNNRSDPQQLQLRVFSSIAGGRQGESEQLGLAKLIDSSDCDSREEDQKIYQAIAARYFEAKL